MSQSNLSPNKPLKGLRLKPRSKYLSLFSSSLHRALAYRYTTFLSLVANLVWVIIPYSIWQRVFENSTQVGSFDWDRMRTYIILAYAVNILLTFRVEARIINTIRTGNIATELMRPIDYMWAQLAEVLGGVVIDGVASMLIVLVLGLALHILAPTSIVTILVFIVSVVLGFLVKFMISYITSLLCFWTLNALGLLWLRAAISNIFSGAVIPLEFLPTYLRTFAYLSPFQAVVHIPLAIYLGDVHGGEVFALLALQVFWLIVLWILARALWIPSIRTLVIQGG